MTAFQHAVFWGALLIITSLLLYYLGAALAPFFFGAVLAYMLSPAADFLEGKKCPRTLAAVILTLGAFLSFVGIFLLLAPILLHQGAALAENIPLWIENLRNLLAQRIGQEELDQAFQALSQSEPSSQNVLAIPAAILWGGGQVIIEIVAFLFISPIVCIYLLRDGNAILETINSALPRKSAPFIQSLFAEIDSAISIFLRAQLSVCVLLAIFYSVVLSLVGLKYGLLIGIFSGLISFIPYAGTLLALILSPTLALFQFWPELSWVAVVFALCALGQIIEAYFLTPRLIGDRIGLHPLAILLALAAFGTFWGFTGLLLAIPAAATLGIALRRAVAIYKESPLYLQGGAR